MYPVKNMLCEPLFNPTRNYRRHSDFIQKHLLGVVVTTYTRVRLMGDSCLDMQFQATGEAHILWIKHYSRCSNGIHSKEQTKRLYSVLSQDWKHTSRGFSLEKIAGSFKKIFLLDHHSQKGSVQCNFYFQLLIGIFLLAWNISFLKLSFLMLKNRVNICIIQKKKVTYFCSYVVTRMDDFLLMCKIFTGLVKVFKE